MRRKKWAHKRWLWLLIAISSIGLKNAAHAEKTISKLDLIVVMDNSGSMKTADDKGIVRKAVKMLVNMMPAVESRIGLIGFNTEPTILTSNLEAAGDLVSLDKYQNAESVRSIIDAMEYSGDTAIGNALMGGVELFEAKGLPDAQKAMILFTDGVDDLGDQAGHELLEAQNDENFEQTLLWAKQNGCPIYSLGFDYPTKDGTPSMGADGEGLLKLKKIEEWTGGIAECTEDINYIEQKFTEMLADICDVRYVDIGEIPGDGQLHEKEISISPSVMEANIRINCATENALNSGRIVLLRPDGTECLLENSDTVRYDVDATAASIKLLLPEKGIWKLQVEGVKGDNIRVGLLEHNNVHLETVLEVPEGNEADTAFLGDTVKIKAYLLDQDGQPVDEAMYGVLTSAVAEAVPRADQTKAQIVPLLFQEQSGCLEGEFTVDAESVYDIHLSVQSERFFYEDDAVLSSSNEPLHLVGEIQDQEVDVKKTLEIPDIYSCVEDLEGDAITAEAVVDNEDKLEAGIDESTGTLILGGKEWGSSNVTVIFTDVQNNSVSVSFHVKVKDFWRILWLNILSMWGILAVIAVCIFFVLRARIIKGRFTIEKVSICRRDLENPLVVTREYSGIVRRIAGKRKSMAGVLKAYGSNAQKTWNPQQYAILKSVLSGAYEPASKIKILGTLPGRNGIRLKAKAGLPVVFRRHQKGDPIDAGLKYGTGFEIEFWTGNDSSIKFKMKYSKK